MVIRFAERMNSLKASEIRELLKLTEIPDIISFAGGLPAPELFPIDQIKEAALKVLSDDGKATLQYSTTEGFLHILPGDYLLGLHYLKDMMLLKY